MKKNIVLIIVSIFLLANLAFFWVKIIENKLSVDEVGFKTNEKEDILSLGDAVNPERINQLSAETSETSQTFQIVDPLDPASTANPGNLIGLEDLKLEKPVIIVNENEASELGIITDPLRADSPANPENMLR